MREGWVKDISWINRFGGFVEIEKGGIYYCNRYVQVKYGYEPIGSSDCA